MEKKVNIISLGCSKNLVDSEILLKQLSNTGYSVSADEDNSTAPIVIVNTCGFIGDAKEESVNTILEQVALKNKGIVKKLIVIGCLSQRYGTELKKEIPEVDAFFGKFDWTGVMTFLNERFDCSIAYKRILTTPSHYAYLKIAEGCDRHCSYCAIPLMTGHYKSRPIEEIVEECKGLAEDGVKELLVMAQDLTYYGIDLYKRNRLADLLRAISDIKGIEWIKLHYAYPAGFPLEILQVMSERDNICKYLDIALQHSSDHMLTLMRRDITREQTIKLINTIRQQVPGIYIRTTLMCGHPGETEEDFQDLCNFVRELKFERLGVFAYSHEDDTYCDKHYKDDVPNSVKQKRTNTIMEIQREISEQHNAKLLGQTIKVIIDRQEGDTYIGRSEHDSPEVDPEIYITTTKKINIGDFYNVTVTDFDDYDLQATL